MGTANHVNAVSLLFMLLFPLLVPKCSSFTWFHYDIVRVNVCNDIDGSLDMQCRSNDDDLRQRTLHKGEYWEWEFHQSLIRNTHFWCDFRWYDNHRWYEGTVTVYKGNGWYDKFHKKCANHCWWSIRPDGFYLQRADRHGQWERRENNIEGERS
ncbi:S-protein homolog 29-like isoform X1 [Papaver somniferum]|uniref:S-protein homolog 29-like isoform X1 n=1 Tax=Papaver somniferum TaxID=3469 RepID=UPI000E6F547D|nr:S-protein homolog 29-like isoform X1 [Papaver somniferum]